jgi:HK97 family phage major capsid protein
MYSDSDWQYVVKTGATANTIDFDDVIDLFNQVPSAYAQNGSWIMNQATWAFLLKQKASTTGTYLYDGMNGMMLQDGASGLLMGKPVYISEFADVHNAASARLQVFFGDIARAYRIVDRREVQFIVDPFSNSGTGIINYRSSMRSDAQIVDKRAGGVIVNKA